MILSSLPVLPGQGCRYVSDRVRALITRVLLPYVRCGWSCKTGRTFAVAEVVIVTADPAGDNPACHTLNCSSRRKPGSNPTTLELEMPRTFVSWEQWIAAF